MVLPDLRLVIANALQQLRMMLEPEMCCSRHMCTSLCLCLPLPSLEAFQDSVRYHFKDKRKKGHVQQQCYSGVTTGGTCLVAGTC